MYSGRTGNNLSPIWLSICRYYAAIELTYFVAKLDPITSEFSVRFMKLYTVDESCNIHQVTTKWLFSSTSNVFEAALPLNETDVKRADYELVRNHGCYAISASPKKDLNMNYKS